MSEPAFRRLGVDERRRQLLELGARLFTEHTYTDLSMAQIARQAGISKALLYHYFPSKQDFFRATLAQGAEELQTQIEPDPTLPPAQQLGQSLAAYLAWIDEHRDAYRMLMQTALSVEEVGALVQDQRDRTASRILAGVVGADVEAPPVVRTAVRGWLWFMDGACEDWIAHADLDRDQLHGLLLGTLLGALTAAGISAANAFSPVG